MKIPAEQFDQFFAPLVGDYESLRANHNYFARKQILPYDQCMTPEIPDPQDFIDEYDSKARVTVGDGDGREMTLAQALQLEALLCTADEAARKDPAKRTAYLAKILATGGSLKPEHEYLLGEGE
jgi:hypothetical protein